MRGRARQSGSLPGRRAPAGPLCGGSQSATLGRDAAVPPSERVLTRSRCDVLLAQEYEYIRFDALAWLARRMNIPLYATFQGGDRTLSWIEAIARQARPFAPAAA